MKLCLHPTPQPTGKVAAAFLGGAHPAVWLRELSRWGLDTEEVRCYVVPQSLQTAEPLGLLVVFGNRVPDLDEIALPYTQVAGKLFIPLHATLTPAFTDDELGRRLLYPVQVFHPTAGLVGFEETDLFSFAPLLRVQAPVQGNWNEALSPLPEIPPLNSVSMPRANAEDFMQQVQQEIGAKPLRQILSNEERNEQRDGLVNTKLALLDMLNRLLGGKSKGNVSYQAFFIRVLVFLGWAYLGVMSVTGLILNRPGWRDAYVWLLISFAVLLLIGYMATLEEKGKTSKKLTTAIVLLIVLAAVVGVIWLVVKIISTQNPAAVVVLFSLITGLLMVALYDKSKPKPDVATILSEQTGNYINSLNGFTIALSAGLFLTGLSQVFGYGIVLGWLWITLAVSVLVMLFYPKIIAGIRKRREEELPHNNSSSAQYQFADNSDAGTSFPWGMALMWAGGIALLFLLVFDVISVFTLFKILAWVLAIYVVWKLFVWLMSRLPDSSAQAGNQSRDTDGSGREGWVILGVLLAVGAIFLVFTLLRNNGLNFGALPFVLVGILLLSLLLRGLVSGPAYYTPAGTANARPARSSWFSRLMNRLRGRGARAGRASSASGAQGGGGWFNRWRQNVQQRVQRSLDDLQKRRESELDRLVRMMDENPEEGLQYAVPLNSNYMGRGGDNGWDTLSRGLPDFSLSGLGGGGGSSSFQSDEHYRKLRERYQKQANMLLEKGDYRKAAYVFAHLLGDLHSAASALEQGRFYREAAALYKDHIKSQLLAAQCLEKGGLLAEAADEYRELQQHEKAGDLYARLSHDEKAQSMYQLCVEQALGQQNYLEAARLQHDKQHHTAAAEHSLLLGWNSTHPQENCLQRYIALRREQHENPGQVAQRLYDKGLTPQQQTYFLNQLRLIHQFADSDSSEAQTTRQLALRIISEQALAGQHQALNQLAHFTGTDRLVQGDVSRFIVQKDLERNNQRKVSRTDTDDLQTIALSKSVSWRKLISGSRYWIALGEQNNSLRLARITAAGEIEVHAWSETFAEPSDNIEIQHNPLLPDMLQLRSRYTANSLPSQYLSASPLHPASFAALFFNYLPERLLAYAPGLAENSCWVLLYHPQLSLQYWVQGKLVSQHDLKFNTQVPEALTQAAQFASFGYYADEYFYCNYQNYFLKIHTHTSVTEYIELPDAAYNVQLSAYHREPVFTMSSYGDIFVVQPSRNKVWRKILGEFVSECTFISYKHLAYYREEQLIICELGDNGEMPVVFRRPIGPGVICLATAGRNQVAWLESNGSVKLLKVPLGM